MTADAALAVALRRLGQGQPTAEDLFALMDAAAAGRLVVVEKTPEAERRARLPDRDALIRQTRDRFYQMAVTLAAARMAADLADCDDVVGADKRAVLSRIVALNGGTPPRQTTIFNVLSTSPSR